MIRESFLVEEGLIRASSNKKLFRRNGLQGIKGHRYGDKNAKRRRGRSLL